MPIGILISLNKARLYKHFLNGLFVLLLYCVNLESGIIFRWFVYVFDIFVSKMATHYKNIQIVIN